MILSHRMCLADICNALGLKNAVEIGTHHAVFADQFMSRFRGTIELVDPWLEKHEEFPTFYPTLREDCVSRDEDLRIAMLVMEKYGDRVVFYRQTSEQVSSFTADQSVGFVYIDGLHDYESVSRDISLWWAKVKPGGIIAGHDYNPCLPGVVQAVDEFRQREGIDLFFTAEEMSSWWGIKK